MKRFMPSNLFSNIIINWRHSLLVIIISLVNSMIAIIIYNDDKSDKLVVILDFGGSKTATNGDFTIAFPDPSTPSNAIISLTSS